MACRAEHAKAFPPLEHSTFLSQSLWSAKERAMAMISEAEDPNAA